MSETIDGIPVTRRSVRFEGELDVGSTIRAGQVTPMVVLVSVGSLEHTPGHDDDYHRLDVLQVSRLASPRTADEHEYLLGMLRGEPHETMPEPDGDDDVDATDETVDEPPARLVSRAGGGLQAVAAAAATVGDAVDEEDDFVLPPPPPVPEGKETRRRIVPGDDHLRTFLGE